MIRKLIASINLRSKIMIANIGLIVLMGAIVIGFVRTAVADKLLGEVQKRGISVSLDLADESINFLLADKLDQLQLLFESRRQRQPDIEYIFLADGRNAVSVHTFKDGFPSALKDTNTPKDLLKDYQLEQLEADGNRIIDVAVPLFRGEIGVLRVGISLRSINETVSRITGVLELIVLIVVIAAILAAVVLSNVITRPVYEFIRVTKGIGEGKREKVVMDRNDELGRLGAAFNNMIDDLNQTTISKNYFSSIISNMMDTLIVTDASGRIEVANKALLGLLGYSEKELCGKNIEIIDGDDPEKRAKGLRKLISSGSVFGEEKIYLAKDGTKIPVSQAASVMFGGQMSVSGIIYAAQDLRERKRSDKEKERMAQQLIESEKMSAIGRLSGGIAHDFNNLLTAIQGYVELLLIKTTQDNPIYPELHEIHQAAIRATSLTKRLLVFSRNKPFHAKLVNLNDSIANMKYMIERIIGENIKISTELQGDLMPVLVDEDNVTQILMNLSANAKDAMPSGGEITIRTENVKLNEEESLSIPGSSVGSFVRLSVEDTGSGIDGETLKHIFEPFFTTKATGKGTGLGLSVVYGIVKQHNGWINVYSTPDCGTIFKIYFPASEGVAATKEPVVPAESSAGARGKKILLVEDEKVVKDFAVKVLKKYGFQVVEASSKMEALEVFNRENGKFDLIFSDSVLPDGTGVELIEYIKASHPWIPVLLTSGYFDKKSQWDTVNKKEYRFVQKPYTIDALLKALDILLP